MKLEVEKIIGKIGLIHFIGIGGVGMSGIAEILHNLGYQVQGSDIAENLNTKRLKANNMRVFYNHQSENIEGTALVIKSSGIQSDNIELIAARKAKIPIMKRSEMLAEIMRLKISIGIAGTHGKTTTTSLIASMFEAANLNPTVINGGIINAYNTNAYLGAGEYLIAEADESDATFIKIPLTIGVITNINPEHLNFYGNFENLKNAFYHFIENIPFYGFAILCKDHLEVANLMNKVIDKTIITYGIEAPDVDVKAINIKQGLNGSEFDVVLSDRFYEEVKIIKDVYLPVAGLHNVLNSLAAVAIAAQLKFELEIIQFGFRNFKGIKRRFTNVGVINEITVIDDYAHHPKEILATLTTAKTIISKTGGRIIAVFQPHRYSRIHDLFSEYTHCFNYADVIIVTDIYSAGEEPIAGINKEIIAASITQSQLINTNCPVITLDNSKDLAKVISKHVQPKDMVICLGAGNITNWANELPDQLDLILNKKTIEI